ncbi:hypothetical protein, partial [Chryseobacterium sp. CH21]|uniref:hypothetical protein n=1 Tax=Chryseobacterium sp. CH21 TaxID=713556 RepID=UPI0013E9457D
QEYIIHKLGKPISVNIFNGMPFNLYSEDFLSAGFYFFIFFRWKAVTNGLQQHYTGPNRFHQTTRNTLSINWVNQSL